MTPLRSLIASIALLVALWAGYQWWYGQVTHESAKVANLSAQIQMKTQAAAQSTTLASLTADENVVGTYLVSGSQIVSLLSDLQAKGNAAGTNVKIVSVSTDTSAGHPIIVVTLQLVGSFTAVGDAVGRIEYAPYAISTASFSLTKGGGAASNSWSANITLHIGATIDQSASSTPATTELPVAAPPSSV